MFSATEATAAAATNTPLLVTILVMFVVVLVGGFGWATVVLFKDRRRFNKRVDALKGLLEVVRINGPARSRHQVLADAQDCDPDVLGPLWKEFDETLVPTKDGEELFNTLDAEVFFNRENLAAEYASNRLLASVPTLLTTFGVFGTFLSLTVGLMGLNVTSVFTGGASPDAIGAGVEGLIGSAGVAFLKSVLGVAFGLTFTLFEKTFERRIAIKITPLQADIDHLYRRATPEKSLVDVAEYTRESMYSLQELHEKIGGRLQETIQTMSHDLESALTTAITTAMQPSMEKLVETTASQSAEVFEDLVGRFASSFTGIGERQSEMLDASSTRLTAAIDRVGEEFGEIVQKSREQAAEIANRQAEIIVGLESTSEALKGSSADLTSAAGSLGALSDRIESAGEALGSGLAQTAATLMSLYQKAVLQAESVEALQERASAAGYALADSAAILKDATAAFGGLLDRFSTTQSEFQESLRSEAEQLATTLRTHVSDLELSVGKWLADYSSDIENQIDDRMHKWNAQSQDYASHMLTTARALSAVLDEIQNRDQAFAAVEASPAAITEHETPELEAVS